MLTDENKAAYLHFVEETFNEGRLDRLSEFVLPGFIAHDAPPGMPSGPAGVEQVVAMFRTALPDLRVTIDEIVAERDLICVRTRLRGTHRGTLFGMPPTGSTVTMESIEMVRMERGRLAESWVRADVMGLMGQLGAAAGPVSA